MIPKIRIGINEYGRIGRAFHCQTLHDPMLEVVAVNSHADAASLAHLLKYDSDLWQIRI